MLSAARTIRSGSVPARTAPSAEALGPVGRLAQDDDRRAERRRFLLHAAGIGEDEVGAVEQRDEGGQIERLEQADIGGRGAIERGIGMAREEDLDVVARGEPFQRRADRGEGRAEALAAMAGDEDQLSGRIERRQASARASGWREDEMERVDPAIAGHVDVAAEPLGDEIGRASGVGAKCMSATSAMARRFISSGKGALMQ